jgi:predicted flap endonuclease-1-like 5' DNA nuclease
MIALVAFYWYGVLLAFGIGLFTAWWSWGQRKPEPAVADFGDPYEELIEWPAVSSRQPPAEPRPVAAAPLAGLVEAAEPAEPANDQARPTDEAGWIGDALGDIAPDPLGPALAEALTRIEPVTDDPRADNEPEAAPAPVPDVPEAPVVSDPLPPELSNADAQASTDRQPDNLLLIKGVGPQLARLLNSLGVYRFDDIASWMPEDIELIDSHLGSFRGHIIRDEWIQQARLLARGDMETFNQRYGHIRF